MPYSGSDSNIYLTFWFPCAVLIVFSACCRLGGLRSRAAIDHTTKVVAAEYGQYGVRANAVAPGYTITEMTKDFPQEFVDLWSNL